MANLLRVLIVEDQPADAELMVMRLTDDGFKMDWQQVQTEVDYLSALETPPDLILSDWSLPQFSGLRALDLIREQGLDIPFIIVSGSIGEEAAIDALHRGTYNYLLKDRLEQLGQTVRNALEQKRLRGERKKSEEALKKEQYLMRMLMDTVPESIYFKDAQGRFIRVNQSQARTLGANDPDQLIGKTDFDFFGLNHAQAASISEQEIIGTGQPQIDIEEFATYPDRSSEWFATTKMPLRDENGKIVGTFGISRNITQRKMAEIKLQESQRFSQATIDALTAHICVLDENGNILTVNQAWHDFADSNPPIPLNYGLGVNYLEVCDTAQGPNSSEAILFAKGLREIMRGEREQFTLEYPCHVPDGEERWFIARVTSFFGHGPLRMVVAHENVTEQRLAELFSKDSEERYRKLVEESHELIFTHDFNLNILSLNPAMQRLLEITPDSIQGLNLYNFAPIESHKEFELYIQAISRDGIKSGQWQILTKKNDERILEFQSTLLEQEAQVPVVRCMAQDITDKIHREQELEAIAAMSSALRSFAPKQQLLSIILQEINKLVKVDGSAISWLDKENGKVAVELGSGEWRSWTGKMLLLGQGVFTNAFETIQLFIDEKAAQRKDSDWPGSLGNIQTVARIPLIANSQTIGALWLGRKVMFSKRDLRILITLSDISANAIRNADLFKQVEDKVATLASLYDAGLALNSLLEPHEQLEFLLNIALDELKAERMVFLRYLPVDACYVADLCLGFQEEVKASIYRSRYPSGDVQQSPGWIKTNELPLYNPDIASNLVLSLGDSEVHSVLWVSVHHGDNIRGILGAMSSKTNAFNLEMERLLVLFANQAAIAMEHAGLLLETRLQVQRLKALRRIDETINDSLDLKVTSSILLEQITGQLNVDAAMILILDHKSSRFEYIDSRGLNKNKFHQNEFHSDLKLAEQAIKDNQIVHISGRELQNIESPILLEEKFVEYYGVPLISKGKVNGVLQIFHRSPLSIDNDWLDFLRTLAGQAAIAIDDIGLFENLQRSNKELTQAYDATIEGWSQAMDLRDKETEGHTRRVTEMTLQLARVLGLSEEALVHIRRGSLLHDIGKLGVPDQILFKPGPLDENEWLLMKKHPEYAYQMLEPIEYLRPALDIPYCHHEKWDGSGYPRGLKGEQIPLAARIFAIVDVWDALTSDRPYRPAWPKEKTIEHIKSASGTHFDSEVVKSFLSDLE
jgi:PAS domain S-box-containing protein